MNAHPDQLGFDSLLQDSAAANAARSFAKETAHLPATWEEAIPFHVEQIKRHHAAMLDTDFDAALAIKKDARTLALKLNGGEHGIIAHDDAPGCVLDRRTAALPGIAPLWGQSGWFDIEIAGTVAIIEISGMFGIGATAMRFAGFSARAKDPNQPFISETGYRSFLGASVSPEKGMTPQEFVRRVIEAHVAQELKGKLVGRAHYDG